MRMNYPILHEIGSPKNWEFREILEISMTGPYHKIGNFLISLDHFFEKLTFQIGICFAYDKRLYVEFLLWFIYISIF